MNHHLPCRNECNQPGGVCAATHAPTGLACTRHRGHSGEHVACALEAHALGTWPADGEQAVVLWTLYTEDVKSLRTETAKTVSHYFDAFTIITGTGYWGGIAEGALVVQILGDIDDAATVKTLAQSLRTLLDQQAVLVTSAQVGCSLVQSPNAHPSD